MERLWPILQPWAFGAATMVIAIVAAWVARRILFAIGERLTRQTPTSIDNVLLRFARAPAAAAFPLFAVILAMPALPLGPVAEARLQQVLTLFLIGVVGWAALAALNAFGELIRERFRIDHPDNLTEREIQTRVLVLRRVASVLVVIITVCVMLMTIPSIRHVGVSLFASAGVAGLVIGFAARPTLSNLIAGIQIALTAPIRIDDVVIVEGEWGRIEEIGTTFVVVRIWDQRRLVVPLNDFIEKPFQNWTRKTADILGTVFIYADYRVPVEAVRAELKRILDGSDLWDGEIWGLQVTNSTDRTVELRALMGAHDSGKAWDLRCLVRERLIAFLQATYPDCLPRTRAEIEGGVPAPA